MIISCLIIICKNGQLISWECSRYVASLMDPVITNCFQIKGKKSMTTLCQYPLCISIDIEILFLAITIITMYLNLCLFYGKNPSLGGVYAELYSCWQFSTAKAKLEYQLFIVISDIHSNSRSFISVTRQ